MLYFVDSMTDFMEAYESHFIEVVRDVCLRILADKTSMFDNHFDVLVLNIPMLKHLCLK
jgi:hypothetical protein